jgi:hypothetical protein
MNQPARADHAQDTDQENEDTNWWVILSTPSDDTNKHEAREHKAKRLWSKICEVTVSDWLMVIFTGVIAFYAYSQYSEMHNAGAQTDKIIAADDRIAKAMETSVTQSQTAFRETTKQAVVAQRAWLATTVNSTSSSGGGVLTVGQPFDVRIITKNTGRTPALNVRDISAVTGIGDNNGVFLPPDFSYRGSHYIPSGNISPDASVYSDLVYPSISAGQQSAINSGSERLYVYGTFQYDDVFSDHHWFTFCSFLLPGGAWSICPYHNEIDHN